MSGIQPWLAWTSAERILTIHQRGIDEFGGLGGPPNAGNCIDGALGAAANAEAYLEGQRFKKAGLIFAAYLMYSLLTRHCFNDGNKRVGWAAALDVLAALGLGIHATQDEAFGFIDDILHHRIASGEEVAIWIAPRLYAITF